MIDYEEFEMGSAYVEKIVGNETKLDLVPLKAVYVPLTQSLRCFLKKPGMYAAIMDYVNQLKNKKNIVRNIIQSKLWLEKYGVENLGSITLPLYIYYDDLETGNGMGSHAGQNLKFGAVYASIACLPPKIAFQLNSIIFNTLLHTQDKKILNNKKVFSKLIKDLNYLKEHGIVLDVDGKTQVVKFQLVI